MDKLKLEDLAASVAYTLDAENLGEVDFETFCADKAVVRFEGVAAHPGWAKDVMINAIRLAGRFVDALPMALSPERTADRDGFIHPLEVRGSAESATVRMILRDFAVEGLAAKVRVIEGIITQLRQAEPRARITLEVEQQYRNMRYWLEKDFRSVEYAVEAVRRVGLQPTSEAIRGGTDGARLTERGVPTPNLFTGFHNVHSQREWVSLQDMEKAAETVVALAQLWEERA